jgi:hypothetical protein
VAADGSELVNLCVKLPKVCAARNFPFDVDFTTSDVLNLRYERIFNLFMSRLQLLHGLCNINSQSSETDKKVYAERKQHRFNVNSGLRE